MIISWYFSWIFFDTLFAFITESLQPWSRNTKQLWAQMQSHIFSIFRVQWDSTNMRWKNGESATVHLGPLVRPRSDGSAAEQALKMHVRNVEEKARNRVGRSGLNASHGRRSARPWNAANFAILSPGQRQHTLGINSWSNFMLLRVQGIIGSRVVTRH